MSMQSIFTCGFLIAMQFAMAPAYGQELPRPHQLVRDSADQVLELSRSIDGIDDINDADVQNLLELLDPIVGFRQIARAVIGDHSDELNAEQIQRFTSTFRNAMTRFYLESLVTFDLQSVAVIPPENTDETDDQARVRVEAEDGAGKHYDLDYLLRVDTNNDWQVLNMVIDGVNLGASYRSQFDSAMDTYNDADKVIANWRNDGEG